MYGPFENVVHILKRGKTAYTYVGRMIGREMAKGRAGL